MKNTNFTREVYQNEIEPEDMEYNTEKHQPYFEFERNDEKFLIGLDKILECMIIADKIGEIPPLGNAFWTYIQETFEVDYFDYDILQSE